MNRALFLLILPFFAATTFAADNSCLMTEQQQHNVILTEGPKALSDQSTSDCFQRLVKDEMELLKRDGSTISGDKKAVIEEMLKTAQHEEDEKTETAE